MYSHFAKVVSRSSSSQRLRVSIVAVVTLTILFLVCFLSDISPVSAGSPSRDAKADSRAERFAGDLREYDIYGSDLGRKNLCEICKVLYPTALKPLGLGRYDYNSRISQSTDIGAIRTDGLGEGVRYPQILPENWDAGGVTMMAWVYIVNSQEGDAALLSVRGAGILFLRGGIGQTLMIYTGNSQTWTNNTQIPLHSWHHFALVRVAGTRAWHAYLDGVLDISGVNLVEPTDNPLLYFNNNGYGEWLDGRVAAGKIWKATLSQAEIQAEMGSYAPVRTANIWSVVPMRVHTDLTDQSGMGNTPTAMGELSTEEGPPLETMVSLSGTVSYSGAVVPVRNVVVTLTSPIRRNETTTTDIDGNYAFSGISAGYNYTVTLSKEGDINGITPSDANLVLRHVAGGGGVLSPIQRIAADTNDNGVVTSFDASQIFRFVVAGGPTNGTGIAGDWKVTPPLRSYIPLLNSLGNEDYDAILIGEVNGDWTAPPPVLEQCVIETEKRNLVDGYLTLPAITMAAEGPTQNSNLTGVQISLPLNSNAGPGATISIPVTLNNNDSKVISGFSFAVTFDPSVIQPANQDLSSAGTLSNVFSVVADTNTSGRLGFAAAGGNSVITGTGTLLNLRFTVVGQPMATTVLTLNSFLFEGDQGEIIPTVANGGSFMVFGPTAASVIVSGRILTALGQPIANSIVTMTSPTGEIKSSRSNQFGVYRFFDVAGGQTYAFTVRSKRHSFAMPTIIRTINDEVADIDFVAIE